MPNLETTIEIGKISQYLSRSANAKGNLFNNGNLDNQLPQKLMMVWETLEYIADIDPTDSNLIATKNYLFALCGKYGPIAFSILGNNGGEVIIPPTSPSPFIIAIYIQFVIGEPLSPMNAGNTVLTLNYEDILAGSVSVEKDTVPLPIGISTQQSYTIVYGAMNSVITFNEPVADGQLFVIRGLRYFNA